MKRSLPDYESLRAILGLAVIALQVLGALHFTLVWHGYSAALGGVVHVHALSRTEQRSRAKRAAPRTTISTADTPLLCCGAVSGWKCTAQLGAAQRALAAAVIAYGEARLPDRTRGELERVAAGVSERTEDLAAQPEARLLQQRFAFQ